MGRQATDITSKVVMAAGAIVWRADPAVEILLVHRPKYDDWSFPKGKLGPGEHLVDAAVREVAEETGVAVRLGAPLPTSRYLVEGAPKTVRYWSATPFDGTGTDLFTPNREVDKREWVTVDAAYQQLTHERDQEVLEAFTPQRTRTLVVLRHTSAMRRAEWAGPDIDRPLSEVGVHQAGRLTGLLAAYGIERVVSSDAERCLATVLPYATEHGLVVEQEPAFNEAADAAITRSRAQALGKSDRPTVVCTHRPTLPSLLQALGVEPVALEPGGLLVLHLTEQERVALERHTV